MVHNDCDRKSPKDHIVPLPNGLNGLQMGVTNHVLTTSRMIFRVGSRLVIN